MKVGLIKIAGQGQQTEKSMESPQYLFSIYIEVKR